MERIRNKIFSLDEANRLIPELTLALDRLTALGKEVTSLRREIEVLAAIESSGAESANPDVRALREQELACSTRMQEFRQILEEVNGQGVILRDLEMGLVDFYTVAKGQVVCLCWKRGESRIEHWHPLDEGFSGRRPLEDLA
ncbi:MAG TPA: DUF2203 domain-containing protein [Thermoanaerobaculia bacterium]|nr:DUF2203 domain-containing protein [Thermoanaerobaculia bacterium]